MVGGAPFARGAASRGGAPFARGSSSFCFGFSAARKPEQLLDIFVVFFDSDGTIPRCKTLEAIALATAEDKLIDHVYISQAFLQGDLLEEEGFEGDMFISPPPGYSEDAKFVYRL